MKVVNRILVIGLSNVGDAILMTPVIEQLHRQFPEAQLTLVVGERAKAVFAEDPRVTRLVAIDAVSGFWGRLRLVQLVWAIRPDVLVDLRQTILPLLWRPWRAHRYFWPVPRSLTHMRARHLWRLQRQSSNLTAMHGQGNGRAVWWEAKDEAGIDQLLTRWGLGSDDPLVIIAPGARSHIKRWYPERFAQVADRLIDEASVEIVFVGEPSEASLINEITSAMRHPTHNATGRTTLKQLALLMQRAQLVITNDSASLHLACAVSVPVLALFGPTDPRKYGPTGPRDRVIQRQLFCVPCEQALCRFNHECMRFISAEEVFEAARQILVERVR